MLKALECLFLLPVLIEFWWVVFGNISECLSDFRVVFYEASVVASKTGESTEVFEVSWSWPLKDTVNFIRVHSDFTWFENVA